MVIALSTAMVPSFGCANAKDAPLFLSAPVRVRDADDGFAASEQFAHLIGRAPNSRKVGFERFQPLKSGIDIGLTAAVQLGYGGKELVARSTADVVDRDLAGELRIPAIILGGWWGGGLIGNSQPSYRR
ncbi:hypothetical protein GCM10023166_35170 [Paeniglutamicibacter cryotolerans]